MAERQTPTPGRGGESGGRPQQAPYRDSGERRTQTSYQGGGERRPQASYPGGGERRPQAPSQSGGERRQASPRRYEVIRCENCGEDYSVTYKRCPFCDERPGRGGISGKRVANTRGGGYGRPASALKIASWVASALVVCFALVIVYRFMGSPLFGGRKDPDVSSSSSQGSGSGSPGTSSSNIGTSSSNTGTSSSTPGPNTPDNDPGTSDPGTTPPPSDPDSNPGGTAEPPASTTRGTIVDAGSGLNIRSGPGRDNPVIASASNGTQVVILGEENGWYQIRYSGNQTGYVSKEFVSTGSTAPDPGTTEPDPGTTEPDPGTTEPDPGTVEPDPSTPVTSGTMGTIINAGNGLNIRSGPGTDNSVVASASNGAQVVILGEENGWYHIRYSGNQTGYVSKEFVSIR